MNQRNWRRSRTQRADDLERCLTGGHSLSPVWPHACSRRCGFSLASPFDPATPANIARIRAQAAEPWPERGWAVKP